MSAKYWCFTLNNPTEAEIYILNECPNWATYLIFGKEHFNQNNNPDSTPHLQGYLECRGVKSLRKLSTWLIRAHFEIRRGSSTQAAEYCKKEGDFTEFGTCSTTSDHVKKSTLLNEMIVLIKDGKSNSELMDLYGQDFIRQKRHIDMVRTVISRPDMRPKDVKHRKIIVNYGSTGLGKSRSARSYCDDYWVLPIGNGFWFDGYQGHKSIILDDFAGKSSAISLTHLLQLCDRYTIQGPIKGSFVWLTFKYLIITTNIHPVKWYNYADRPEQYKALCRRITTFLTWKSGTGSESNVPELTVLDPEEVHTQINIDIRTNLAGARYP